MIEPGFGFNPDAKLSPEGFENVLKLQGKRSRAGLRRTPLNIWTLAFTKELFGGSHAKGRRSWHGRLRLIFASAVFTFGFSTLVVAGPFEDGMAAYDRADYSSAMRYWRPLADQGNPAAQSNLALMYAKGQGVSKDYVQALYVVDAVEQHGVTRKALQNRDSIAKGMTPTGIADGQKRAVAWQPGEVRPLKPKAPYLRKHPLHSHRAQRLATTPTTTTTTSSSYSSSSSSRSPVTTTTTIIRR